MFQIAGGSIGPRPENDDGLLLPGLTFIDGEVQAAFRPSSAALSLLGFLIASCCSSAGDCWAGAARPARCPPERSS